MSEKAPKENEGVFVGHVEFVPEFQFVPSGKQKAELRVVRTETWTGKDGNDNSREVKLTFKFFGLPADWLEKKDLQVGEKVAVTYNLGSWEGKDKATGELTGKHFPDLKGFTVNVLDRKEAKTPEQTGDISF